MANFTSLMVNCFNYKDVCERKRRSFKTDTEFYGFNYTEQDPNLNCIFFIKSSAVGEVDLLRITKSFQGLYTVSSWKSFL